MKNAIIAVLAAALLTACGAPILSAAPAADPPATTAPPTDAERISTLETTVAEGLATLRGEILKIKTLDGAQGDEIKALRAALDREIERAVQADALHDRMRIATAADRHTLHLHEGFRDEPNRQYVFCYGEHVTVRIIGAPEHFYYAKVVDGNLAASHEDHTVEHRGQIARWGAADLTFTAMEDPDPTVRNRSRAVEISHIVLPTAPDESKTYGRTLSVYWADTCRHR